MLAAKIKSISPGAVIVNATTQRFFAQVGASDPADPDIAAKLIDAGDRMLEAVIYPLRSPPAERAGSITTTGMNAA